MKKGPTVRRPATILGMAEFKALHSYQDFESNVKNKARFVRDADVEEFLKAVIETSLSRRKRLKAGSRLYRAQSGFSWVQEPVRVGPGDDDIESIEVPAAHPKERMIPRADKVGDGRINPRGIPCLYLATTSGAAVAEMRPWVNSYVTLAQFKIQSDCVVLDCSSNVTQSFYLSRLDLEKMNEPRSEEYDADTRERGVWGDIGYALSRPVNREEPHLDYIPTQILAEAFRSCGVQGIIYKSLLDEKGMNVAM